MNERLNQVLCGLISFAFLAFTACAPTATTKPEVASTPSPQKAAVAKEKASKAGAEKAPRTSLEAFQAGKAPAASPLKEIYFDFDKYDLRPDARAALKANAGWLKANPSAQVEIEGHADERGTNEYNLALGAKRAQAAGDYLSTLGIPAGRLSTKSYGEEVPVCREKSEGCWQKNRRDRFVVKAGKPGL